MKRNMNNFNINSKCSTSVFCQNVQSIILVNKVNLEAYPKLPEIAYLLFAGH